MLLRGQRENPKPPSALKWSGLFSKQQTSKAVSWPGVQTWESGSGLAWFLRTVAMVFAIDEKYQQKHGTYVVHGTRVCR